MNAKEAGIIQSTDLSNVDPGGVPGTAEEVSCRGTPVEAL